MMDFSDAQKGEYVVLGSLASLWLAGSLSGLSMSQNLLVFVLGAFTYLPVLVLQLAGIVFPIGVPMLAFFIPATLFAYYRRTFGDVFFFLSFGSMLVFLLGA